MLTLLDISQIYFMIQKLNSYNLLPEKWFKKSFEQFTDQIKKAKIANMEMNFP